MKEWYFGNNRWMEEWWDRIYDPDTVKMMADIGVNMIVPQFYKGAGLKFETDLRGKLNPLIENCHKHDIRVVGYTQLGTIFPESMKLEEPECPEWTVREYNGDIKLWNYYRWRKCCNQPGLISYMKKVIDVGVEIGIDGFHFDNAAMFPCYCDRCRQGFRDYLTEKIKTPERMWITDFRAVEPPPPSSGEHVRDPMEQEWLRYSCEKGAKNIGKLADYIKQINPELLVMANTAFPRYEKWSREFGIDPAVYGKKVDFMVAENVNFPGFERGKLTTQIEAFSFADAIGFEVFPASWVQNYENGKVDVISNSAQAKMAIAEPQIWGSAPGIQHGLRTVGGSSVVIDDPEIAAGYGDYIRFFDQHKELLRDARPFAKVGILHSFDSLTLGGHEVYMSSSGIQLTLISANIPYRFIMESDLSVLKEFSVVLVANLLCLSDATCERLIAFAHQGGRLYISGNSGKYDENFLERRENAFACLAGYANVAFFPDVPEACPEVGAIDFKICDWLGTEINLPPRHEEVAKEIRSLLGNDNFIRVGAPASVVVTPRMLPNNTLALHVLNYDHANKVDKVEVELRLSLAETACTLFNPDRNLEQKVKIDGIAGAYTISFRELETYQVAVFKLA
jgi:hypothetical protein